MTAKKYIKILTKSRYTCNVETVYNKKLRYSMFKVSVNERKTFFFILWKKSTPNENSFASM